MPKLKNRDKRKAAKVKKRNQAKQQKREAGEFVKEFTGYMQLSFKEETDDETIRKNVILCGDWLKNSYQIFKHDRYYLVEVLLRKFDETLKPAELGWATKDKLFREDIVEVARQMAEELAEGENDVDFDSSYIRISA